MTYDPQRNPNGADDLQFDRAEAAAPPPPPGAPGGAPPVDYGTPATAGGPAVCAACAEPITDAYFEAGGKVVCPRCREAVAASLAGGSAIQRLGKATVFGLGAAVAGALAWYILERFGIRAAIVAILMGWLVGTGVRRGSNGRGGVGYQILAVLLTYLSIAISRVPELVQYYFQHQGELNAVAFTVIAAGIVLASPVIMSTQSILTPIIIVIGLWQAWVINRPGRLTFNGPYRLAPTGAAPAAPGYAPTGYAPAGGYGTLPPPPPPPTGNA